MNWRIFLLTSKLETHVPYDTFVGYLKARSAVGRRFKAGELTSHGAVFYYGNVGSTKESMGYRATFLNELSIPREMAKNGKIQINFGVPARLQVGYLLIILLVLLFAFNYAEFGIKGAAIVIGLVYFGIVIDLNSQLYYLKDELEAIENSYQKTIRG